MRWTCIYVNEVDAAIMDGSKQPSCCCGKLLYLNYKTEQSYKMKGINNCSAKKSRCEKEDVDSFQGRTKIYYTLFF